MDRRRFLKVTAITGTSAALAGCGNPENQFIRFVPDEEITPGIAVWKPSVCPLCSAGCGVQARVMDGDAEVFRNGQPGVTRMGLPRSSKAIRSTRSARAGCACAARRRCRSPITPIASRAAAAQRRARQRQLRRKSPGTRRWPIWPAGSTRWWPGQAGADRVPRRGRGAAAGRRWWRSSCGGSARRRRWRSRSSTTRCCAAPTRSASAATSCRRSTSRDRATSSASAPTSSAPGTRRWRRARPTGGCGRAAGRCAPSSCRSNRACRRPGPAPTNGWRCGPAPKASSRSGWPTSSSRAGLAPASGAGRAGALVEGWAAGLPAFTPAEVEQRTGVAAARVERLAREFAAHRPVGRHHRRRGAGAHQRPGPGAGGQRAERAGRQRRASRAASPSCRSRRPPAPPARSLRDAAGRRARHPAAAARRGATRCSRRRRRGRPPRRCGRIPFIVSFGSFLDDTSVLADLILPDHSFLESWIESHARVGGRGRRRDHGRPGDAAALHTRAMPDVLLDVGRRLKQPLDPPLPWQTFEEMAAGAGRRPRRAAAGTAGRGRGGSGARRPGPSRVSTATPPSTRSTSCPTRRRRSRRVAGAPAVAAGAARPDDHGDVVQLGRDERPHGRGAGHRRRRSRRGRVGARYACARRSCISPGIGPDAVAMPVGQGHETFTRYASGRGANPIASSRRSPSPRPARWPGRPPA